VGIVKDTSFLIFFVFVNTKRSENNNNKSSVCVLAREAFGDDVMHRRALCCGALSRLCIDVVFITPSSNVRDAMEESDVV